MDAPGETRHKDNSGIMIASVATFILVSLGVVVFLYNQNQTLKAKLISCQPQPVVTPVSTIIPQLSASPSASPKVLKTPKVSTSSGVFTK